MLPAIQFFENAKGQLMDEFIDKYFPRLITLSSESKPGWGKMSSQHMVEHLIFTVRISNGKLTVGCLIPQERWPTMKNFLMSERPLPKNFVNPVIGVDLAPLEFQNIEEAKINLANEYSNFNKYFHKNPQATILNPTFGELNKTEWVQFHRKHFTHHFEQFNLL
jgi:hypothetical protein